MTHSLVSKESTSLFDSREKTKFERWLLEEGLYKNVSLRDQVIAGNSIGILDGISGLVMQAPSNLLTICGKGHLEGVIERAGRMARLEHVRTLTPATFSASDFYEKSAWGGHSFFDYSPDDKK